MNTEKIKIDKKEDINEFLKAGNMFKKQGIEVLYIVAEQLYEEFLRAFKKFYNNHKISIKIYSPDFEVVEMFCDIGGILGLGIGILSGGIYYGPAGVVIGGIGGYAIGNGLGYLSSHVQVVIKKRGQEDDGPVEFYVGAHP